jgi:hypothetical protein
LNTTESFNFQARKTQLLDITFPMKKKFVDLLRAAPYMITLVPKMRC